MKSRSPVSAKCRSSKIMTTGLAAASRSKKSRQAPNSCSDPIPDSSPSRVRRAGSTQRRSVASGTYSATVAAIRSRVVASSSDSARRGPRPDHLAEGPERDPVAVRRGAARVPEHGPKRPSRYFSSSQARRVLPIPAGPITDTRRARRSRLVAWKRSLSRRELVVAADEGSFERLGPLAAAPLGNDAEALARRHGRGFTLERLVSRRLESDRLGGGPLGRLADEHRARGGRRLQPRRGVDEIARDHPLVRGAEGDGGFAGENPGPGLDRRAQGAHRVHQLEGGADRPLRVVLAGRRGTPDRHDRIADELLDRPAVAAHDLRGELEVARQELPRLLGVTALGERA